MQQRPHARRYHWELCKTGPALRQRFQREGEDLPVCVQERVKCKIDALWAYHFYCKDGEIVASFTGRKLHQEPPDFGTGSICITESNPQIIEESRNFSGQLNMRV